MDKNKNHCSLPEKPKEPLHADCCGSGCSYCVFDVYQTEVLKWKKECERLLQGGNALFIKENRLSQLEFKTFELIEISASAKNTNIYKFSVPGGLRLDINPGQHLIMKGFVESECKVKAIEDQKMLETVDVGVMRLTNETKFSSQKELETDSTTPDTKAISRPYTILNNQPGYFEVLIKVYENGEMSKYTKTLKLETHVLWRGPFGDYHHNASYSSKSDSGPKTILALCAGTGVAPVYAISKAITSDEDDDTRIRLLWASHSWEDLPLIREMKELTSYWNFSCRIFLTRHTGVPPFSSTFFEVTNCKMNYEHLKQEMDLVTTTDKEIMICGTKSFEEDMMAFLVKLKIDNCIFHKFQ